MHPLLTVHEWWQYVGLTVLGFAALFVFDDLMVRKWIGPYWLRRILKQWGGSVETMKFPFDVTTTIFNVLSFLVYCFTTYITQFGFTFGWFAIVAAVDIFVGPFNITDQHHNPLPPPSQAEQVLANITGDAVSAMLAVGATLLFRQFVHLS